MRMKSTGLGRTELVGSFDRVTLDGDYLILSVRTSEPVRWHVRTALSRKDALDMLKLVLKPRVLLFFLASLRRSGEGQVPKDY